MAGVMAKLSASGVMANIGELRALVAGTKNAIRAEAARLIADAPPPAPPITAAPGPATTPAPLEVAAPDPSQELPTAPDAGVHSDGGIPCVD